MNRLTLATLLALPLPALAQPQIPQGAYHCFLVDHGRYDIATALFIESFWEGGLVFEGELEVGPQFELCFPSRTDGVDLEDPTPPLLCVETLAQNPDPMDPTWRFEGSYAQGDVNGVIYESSRTCFPFELQDMVERRR